MIYNPEVPYGKANVPAHSGRNKKRKNRKTGVSLDQRGTPVAGVGGGQAGSHRRGMKKVKVA
jgi:hypothetical protein